MPTSARDLQAKIQAKIDEENQRKSFSTASTGTSNTTKSSTGSNPPITEVNSHDGTFAKNPSAAAAACASQPPEPIMATEQDESESGSHLATCSAHGRSSISSFPEDRLRDKLLSSRNHKGKGPVSNSNSQRSLGDTQSSAGGTTSRTPDERLRDKIARENSDSGHGSNYSLDTSSHSPGSQRRIKSPDERMREKITQQGGAGAGGGQAADPTRHHHPSQVQEIMAITGEAARASAVGARRVQGSPPSKADGARDDRVGAFAIQASSHSKIDEEYARPPEPIEVTDPHYLTTCAVLNGSTRTTSPRDGGGLTSISGGAKSETSNLLDLKPNSSCTQHSLEDTCTHTASVTPSRTPEEQLRDKIAGRSCALEESKNDSVDPPGDHCGGEEQHQQDQRQQNQQQNRHHRPSQVQEIMDFAVSAARSSPVRIGARRVPAGVGMSSKTDTSTRDERVGAFFVQSTSHSPNNVDDEGGQTLDSLGLTEEEQRWISLESGHPLSSSSGATGLQAPEEEEHASSQQQQQQQQQQQKQHNDKKNTRSGRDLVCGMRKHVFVGIVVAFAVLTVAIVGTAIGVSTSSKPSPSLTPPPPTDKPHSQSNQTGLPVPSPTEPESICENSIVELQKQRLDEPDDEFGSSIAISRNNAVVGATGCDSCRGAAFVYERSGDNVWFQTAQLFPLESYLGDSFGKSIDIDGDIIAVGGNCMVEVGYQKVPAGCVHVFVRTGGNRWTQEAILYGNDGVSIPEVSFASSLAIDDGTLVVGEPSGDFQEQGDRSGFIYIYERQNDAMWTKVAKIRPSDAQDRDDFGYSLDLDEEYLVVGAPRRHSGAAYVFSRQLDGTWLERMKLIPHDASEGDSFARSVSITQYGTIAVGAVGDDDSGYSSGSVYVYEIDGTGQWVESAKLIPDDGLTSDRFGASVAIFRETIVVGAIGVDDQGENSGAVYSFSFDLSTSSWQQTSKIVAPDGGEKAEFGSDIDVYGTTALVASFYNAPGLLVGGLVDTGKVYAVDLLC